MRLRFLRLGIDVELTGNAVRTLEIEDRVLFARVVGSLLSEAGEYADEPYALFGNDDKRVAPKKAMHVVNTLPEVPLNDRALIAGLLRFVVSQSELDSRVYEQVRAMAVALEEVTDDIVSGMRGDYSLALEWNYETYLKSFGLSPVSGEGHSLLDNCIHLLGLCADIGDKAPIVLVNPKSFFSKNELEELLDQAVFCGVELLLLESWKDDRSFSRENKTTIDQHLCVV